MNIQSTVLMARYTGYRLGNSDKNIVKEFINNQKQQFFGLVSIFNGKAKADISSQIEKYNRQIQIIEKNLNTSSKFTNHKLDILR